MKKMLAPVLLLLLLLLLLFFEVLAVYGVSVSDTVFCTGLLIILIIVFVESLFKDK